MYHTKYDSVPWTLGGVKALWAMMEAVRDAGSALVNDDSTHAGRGLVNGEGAVYFERELFFHILSATLKRILSYSIRCRPDCAPHPHNVHNQYRLARGWTHTSSHPCVYYTRCHSSSFGIRHCTRRGEWKYLEGFVQGIGSAERFVDCREVLVSYRAWSWHASPPCCRICQSQPIRVLFSLHFIFSLVY
jgi:hypothetical protein